MSETQEVLDEAHETLRSLEHSIKWIGFKEMTEIIAFVLQRPVFSHEDYVSLTGLVLEGLYGDGLTQPVISQLDPGSLRDCQIVEQALRSGDVTGMGALTAILPNDTISAERVIKALKTVGYTVLGENRFVNTRMDYVTLTVMFVGEN